METRGKIIVGSQSAWYEAEDIIKLYPKIAEYPHEIIYVAQCNRNFICIPPEVIPLMCKDLECSIEMEYDRLTQEWTARILDE